MVFRCDASPDLDIDGHSVAYREDGSRMAVESDRSPLAQRHQELRHQPEQREDESETPPEDETPLARAHRIQRERAKGAR